MNVRRSTSLVSTLLLTVLAAPGWAQTSQTPAQFFGYTLGDDPRVPNWSQIAGYFEHLGETSERVQFEVVAQSSEGRPIILATVSSPQNLARAEELREIQAKLADPRRGAADELESLVRDGRPAMLFFVAEAAHTAAWLAQIDFLHRVATEQSEQIGGWMDDTVLLFMATMNPDGLDFVHDWVEKTRGTEWQGSDIPELSSFNGEINRDWYTYSMVEARAVIEVMQRWQVNAIHDIHTMGNQPRPGVRFWTPPFIGPVEPNIHPLIWHLQGEMGMAMTGHVVERGLPGVAFNSQYDLWNPARGYAQHHHTLRILTESSAPRLSAPTHWNYEDLGPEGGVDVRVPSSNFPLVWYGGEWGNKQILPYIAAALEAEVGHLSKNRGRYLRAKHIAVSDALEGAGAPYAYLVPPEQHDPSTMREMLWMLDYGEVEVHRASAPFTADGNSYPAGTYVALLRQPFGNFAKAMLEPQVYPEVRACDTCPVRAPYDVVAFSYPYAMGVSVVAVEEEFEADLSRVEEFPAVGGAVAGMTDSGVYLLPYRENAALKAMSELLAAGVEVAWADASFEVEGRDWPAGTIVVSAGSGVHAQLETLATDLGLSFTASDAAMVSSTPLSLPRVAMYRPYVGGRNGYGSARLLFPEYGIPYEFVVDEDIRGGDLHSRFDAIILPAYRTPSQLLNGYAEGTYPPEMTGGIGATGVEALEQFLQDGGTIVTLGQSTDFAIDQFQLPVERLSGLTVSMFGRPIEAEDGTPPEEEFVVPGSYLRIEADTEHPIAYGMPEEFSGMFNRGQVLTPAGAHATPVATFPSGKLLLSGMALGESLLEGKSPVIEVSVGSGRVVLFAIRPELRMQPRGTYKLLFNALYLSTAGGN